MRGKTSELAEINEDAKAQSSTSLHLRQHRTLLYPTSPPTLAMTSCIPGQPLSPSNSTTPYTAGPGTFSRGGRVYSSLLGSSTISSTGLITVSGKDDSQTVPEPNSTIIGTVTRVTRAAATLSLLTVDGRPCRPDFVGVIRAQDVRQTAKDSVKVRLSCCGPSRSCTDRMRRRRFGHASDREMLCGPKWCVSGLP